MPYDSGKVEAEIRASGTNFDSTVSVRSVCGDVMTEIACDHDANGNDTIEFVTTANQSRFVWIDGWAQAEGEYALRFDPTP